MPQELRDTVRCTRREEKMKPVTSLHGVECSWQVHPQEPRKDNQWCHTIGSKRSHQYYSLCSGLLNCELTSEWKEWGVRTFLLTPRLIPC